MVENDEQLITPSDRTFGTPSHGCLRESKMRSIQEFQDIVNESSEGSAERKRSQAEKKGPYQEGTLDGSSASERCSGSGRHGCRYPKRQCLQPNP
jgi:hypothetical protein